MFDSAAKIAGVMPIMSVPLTGGPDLYCGAECHGYRPLRFHQRYAVCASASTSRSVPDRVWITPISAETSKSDAAVPLSYAARLFRRFTAARIPVDCPERAAGERTFIQLFGNIDTIALAKYLKSLCGYLFRFASVTLRPAACSLSSIGTWVLNARHIASTSRDQRQRKERVMPAQCPDQTLSISVASAERRRCAYVFGADG